MKLYIRAAISEINNESDEDRQDIALNPNTPVEVLEQLSDDKSTAVRICLLCNPALPDYLIDKLLSTDDIILLEQVAVCMSAPPKILTILGDHWRNLIRSRVAWNPYTPASVLRKLSDDDNIGVRANVAGNKNTPTDILEKLSVDSDVEIRAHIAENLSTPISILQRLFAEDDDDFVRGMARRNLHNRGLI